MILNYLSFILPAFLQGVFFCQNYLAKGRVQNCTPQYMLYMVYLKQHRTNIAKNGSILSGQKGIDTMKQCPKGHIYDEKRNPECPYCNNSAAAGFQPIGAPNFAQDFPKTMPVSDMAETDFPPTIPSDSGGNNPGAMSVTVALDNTPSGISPVRGWLVAVDNEKAGTSYIIHGEQNSIGRGTKFDINLSFDKTVSSDGNAVIAYDSHNKKFFLSPVLGKGKNNIYHNDSMLLMPTELHDYDKIRLGTTTYVFRSFCNEEFTY